MAPSSDFGTGGKKRQFVRPSSVARAARRSFSLPSPMKTSFTRRVAATLEFLGDGEQRIETVGHAMGAGEAGDEVIRADARQSELGAL